MLFRKVCLCHQHGPPIRIDGAHFHLLESAQYPEHNEDHAIRTQRILLVQTTSHPNIVKPDAQRPISFLFIFLYTKYQQNGRPCCLRAAGPDQSCAHIASKIGTSNSRRGFGSQPRAIKVRHTNHCPSLQCSSEMESGSNHGVHRDFESSSLADDHHDKQMSKATDTDWHAMQNTISRVKSTVKSTQSARSRPMHLVSGLQRK